MIRFDAVSKSHGQQLLFVEASFATTRGDKVGLVGPNGAGKTTVFRLIMKEELPDDGGIASEKGTTIGYFRQDVGEMSGKSILETAMDGAGRVSDVARSLKKAERGLADPEQFDQLDKMIELYGELQTQYEALGGYALESRAREILAGLGFADDILDNDIGTLSGGWKMRVALAQILLMQPDVLLLDEPTNHLDLESILWLEQFLHSYEGVIILTSHDREFMNRLVNKIVEIDSGEMTSYTGNYDFYEEQRRLRALQQEAQFERQQAMLAKERRFIERFKAHAAKSAQVQSRVKKLDKIETLEPPRSRKVVEFEFRQPARSGEEVAKLQGISKAYGNRTIYKDFDFLVRRRERWCVMGVNGAGKSTLLKMIVGQNAPDAGIVTIGANVRLGYFAQQTTDTLDPSKTVYEAIESYFSLASPGSLRNLAGAFGFTGADIDKPVRILSGGEKARVAMAIMMYDPPNFLVLDEPTNHLDIWTKEMLLQALADFEGTMLVVSHDRRFLGHLTNRVLEVSDTGPRTFLGGYTEYVRAMGYEAPGVRLSK